MSEAVCEHDSIASVLFGLVTVPLPYLIMQPAYGLGVAAFS